MRPAPEGFVPRPARGPTAFTLVEVLVSLAIFALAAVVLSAAYLNVLSSYQAAGRRQVREEDWKLVRAAVLAEPDRAAIEKGGSVPLPGGETLEWEAEIVATEIADLFAVVIRVQPRGDAAEVLEGRALVLRPAWSDPGERDRLRAASKARLDRERGS
ncbi:MAG TPA: prepilin-type N-terminal cleavage/methylation domain-containing protein [Opitutaceae bacterium]|nr:prepilin-type N-terminal cleavage/methylation domain-containing protein [Opitutaceae bacterium]